MRNPSPAPVGVPCAAQPVTPVRAADAGGALRKRRVKPVGASCLAARLLAALCLAVLFCGAAPLLPWAPTAALAQTAAADPDYDAWDRFADSAENTVARGSARDEVLARLRDQATTWRNGFQQARDATGPRIATLREQIAALGAAPAEGATEDADVAARRKTLNEQLAAAQAPATRADEAVSRANALIESISALQRRRQATALLHRWPSPLLPSSWSAAVQDGVSIAQGFAHDFADRAGGAEGRTLPQRLPAVLGYLIAAGLLLVYGRRWIDLLPLRASERANAYSRDALAFVVSLGQIAVPSVGVLLLVGALDTSDLFGDWGRPVLMAIPLGGLILFSGRWLVRRFFPLRSDPPICFPESQRIKARRTGTWLAATMGLHHVISTAILPMGGLRPAAGGSDQRIPLRLADASAAIGHLPMIVIGAVLLYRLCTVLRCAPRHMQPGTQGYRHRVVGFAGNLGRVLAVLAPVAMLAGYVGVGNLLVWPPAQTLALIGLVIVLQEFIADLYAVAKRDNEGSRDALAPVLIGFALVLASMPIFALIWGARVSELSEAWTRLSQGVSLGGIRLSPGRLLTFAIVFTLGYLLTRLIQGTFRNSILPRTRLDAGAQNAAVSGLGYVGILLTALLAITTAGIDLSSLAIVAGALSVGIGFGLQNIVSNFVSGVILLIERPVTVGDWIQVGTAQGIVKRISVRSTQIQTFDRTDVIVPNSDLISQPVTNWTRGSLQGRIIVPVGVAYGSDTRKVARILLEIAEDQPIVLIDPPPSVLFTGFGADSLDFEVRAILSDVNRGVGVQTEIRHQIIERFAAEGIEIPFAHREVRILNPEVLNPEAIPSTAAPAAPPTSAAAPAPAGRDATPKAPEQPTAEAIAAAARDDKALDPRIASASSSGIEDAGSDDGNGDDTDGDDR